MLIRELTANGAQPFSQRYVQGDMSPSHGDNLGRITTLGMTRSPQPYSGDASLVMYKAASLSSFGKEGPVGAFMSQWCAVRHMVHHNTFYEDDDYVGRYWWSRICPSLVTSDCRMTRARAHARSLSGGQPMANWQAPLSPSSISVGEMWLTWKLSPRGAYGSRGS